MTMGTAFGISEDDIETVLRQNATQVASSGGIPFEQMAEHIFSEWAGGVEHGRIEDAALNGGVDMDEQTDAAHAEIRAILVEQGVLKR